MSRIINGVLSIPAFTPTVTPGEYTFSNAAYTNQSDIAGNGTSELAVGYILIVPASDTINFNMIPGVAHRYKLTSLTIEDSSHVAGTMIWDEDGAEIDSPTGNSLVLISEPTTHYKFALPVSDTVYSGLASGITTAAQAIDLQQKIDTVGTDWDVISNHPTSLSGYGILDEVVLNTELQTEVTARIDGDLAEAASRDAAILVETTNRISAINAEITARQNAVASEMTARQDADAAEVTARNSAISTAIDTEVSARNSAISTAIDTEVTARNAAIAVETTARQDALLLKVDSSLLAVSNGVATLDAGGKLLTSQIPASLLGGMSYQGMWNATTNEPVIPAADAANKGYYYIVSVGGTTPIDGGADWQPTDWIVSDGAAWVKIDNTDKVSSINGQIGIVTLDTDDIDEGATNQYFTALRHDYTTLANVPTTFAPAAHNQDWSTIDNVPTTFTPAAHDQAWSTITNTPTSISGYGILDTITNTVNGASGTVTLDTDDVSEGSTNQYFTSLRHDYSTLLNIPSVFTPDAHNQDWSTIDNKPTLTNTVNGESGDVTLTTSEITEGSNKYFTEAKALATILAGLDVNTSGAVTSADSILSAIGKLVADAAAQAVAAASPATVFQATSRYQVVTTTGQEVWVHSSSKAYGNLSWARTGTTLVVNHPAHGHVAGERVILRNVNVDYLCVLINSVATDTYTVTCVDSGATSGSSANYSMGFTYAHNTSTPGSITSGTLSAPSNENVQLISARIHLAGNTRSTTTYDLIAPASATNGVGANADQGSTYIPMHSVRSDGDSLSGIAGAIAMHASSNWGRFQLSNLGVASNGIFILLQF